MIILALFLIGIVLIISCSKDNPTGNNGGDEIIIITSPTSSTVWTVGENISVTWNNAHGSTVDVYFYSGDDMIDQFNDGTANDGLINDACPNSPGNNNRIKIEDSEGNWGWSDYFTVVGGSQEIINITSPTSSTVWIVGQNISVTWNNAQGSTVDVYFYSGSTMFDQFNDGTSNDGLINDQCPDSPGNNKRIKIEDSEGNYGWSDYFTVIN